MKKEYTDNIVEHAFYGIEENIPADRTVVVNLRDLKKVHAALEELNQFFHQPAHMQTLEDVETYMGSLVTNGAFKLITMARCDIMGNMLPDDLDALVDQGVFDAPNSPYYFEDKG